MPLHGKRVPSFCLPFIVEKGAPQVAATFFSTAQSAVYRKITTAETVKNIVATPRPNLETSLTFVATPLFYNKNWLGLGFGLGEVG